MDVKIFLSILLICGVVEGQIKKPAGPPDSEGYKYELGCFCLNLEFFNLKL